MSRIAKLDIINEIIRNLTGALSTATLYSPDHQQVINHFARLTDAFRIVLLEENELLLARVDDELLYHGKPLEKTANVKRLIRYCNDQNIGFLKFSKGFTISELQQMVKVLLGKAPVDSLKMMTTLIQLGSVDAPTDDNVRPISSFDELTEEEKEGVQSQFDNISEQHSLDVEQISSLVAGFIEAFRQNANPFLALVPIRMQDEYTFTHSVDVGILNLAQGMALGIEGQMLHDLGIAGMLHDVGKIFVDREILNKAGKLDDDEFNMIKQHPSRGAQYLMNQEGIPRLAVFSAYEHHMRYDLTGYPKAPPEWKLNISSQMTMISDTFDALRTRRSYKNSWDFSKVSGLLLSVSGTQLNPELTLNFLKMLAQMGEDIESFTDNDESLEAMDEIIGCSCSLPNPRCG
jgi:HD-GYP domain-containing protein (c-di-GMP phosphodiesterase class II)